MRGFLILTVAACACIALPSFAQSGQGEVDVRALFGVNESGEPLAPETADPQPLQPGATVPAETTDPDSLDAGSDAAGAAGPAIGGPQVLTPPDTGDSTVAPDPAPQDPTSIVPAEPVPAEGTGEGTMPETPAIDAAPAEPEPVKTWEERPVVKMRALDKVTARTMTFEAKVGTIARFGDLFIKVQACREPPAIFTTDSAAFIQIWEVPNGQKESVWVFSGWMFASSPALSSIDHPIYDVWVIDCVDPAAPQPPKAEEVTKEPAPAPASEEAPAEVEEVAPAD